MKKLLLLATFIISMPLAACEHYRKGQHQDNLYATATNFTTEQLEKKVKCYSKVIQPACKITACIALASIPLSEACICILCGACTTLIISECDKNNFIAELKKRKKQDTLITQEPKADKN